jgi:hypothetical protein
MDAIEKIENAITDIKDNLTEKEIKYFNTSKVSKRLVVAEIEELADRLEELA